MNCPINKLVCPCPEYSKEGLCDYPYYNGTDVVYIQAKRLRLDANQDAIPGETITSAADPVPLEE